jgi:hypothetical protein
MFSQLYILHKMGRDNLDFGLKLFGATNHISQAITQEIADYTRRALRQSASTCEKLADAKTLDSTIDVQKDHAKAALDDLVAQSNKMGELYLALAKESAKSLEAALEKQPIDRPKKAPDVEASPMDTNAEASAPVGRPSRQLEKNVIKDVVASVVKEAAEAARQNNPNAN